MMRKKDFKKREKNRGADGEGRGDIMGGGGVITLRTLVVTKY